MKQNLRVSLGAVVLALATLAAMIYAWINFRQREIFEIPDDGVAWLDTTSGAQAWKVTPNSPAARAGVRPEDVLIAIDDSAVHNQVQVTKRLFRAGLWDDSLRMCRRPRLIPVLQRCPPICERSSARRKR